MSEHQPVLFDNMTFRQLHDKWHAIQLGAWEALKQGLWKPAKGVPIEAYKPDPYWCYLLTKDNHPTYSDFLGSTKSKNRRHLEAPGVPLLHLMLRLPPHAHDMHQTVEHSIGVMKRAAGKEVTALLVKQGHVTLGEVHDIVMRSAASWSGESHVRNIQRLQKCIEIIASPTTKEICLVVKGKAVRVHGTAGGYCYLELS